MISIPGTFLAVPAVGIWAAGQWSEFFMIAHRLRNPRPKAPTGFHLSNNQESLSACIDSDQQQEKSGCVCVQQ